jgi:hypothetical protein
MLIGSRTSRSARKAGLGRRNPGMLVRDQHDYERFHARPTGWAAVTAKFHRVVASQLDSRQRTQIAEAINMDELHVDELARLRSASDLMTEPA